MNKPMRHMACTMTLILLSVAAQTGCGGPLGGCEAESSDDVRRDARGGVSMGERCEEWSRCLADGWNYGEPPECETVTFTNYRPHEKGKLFTSDRLKVLASYQSRDYFEIEGIKVKFCQCTNGGTSCEWKKVNWCQTRETF